MSRKDETNDPPRSASDEDGEADRSFSIHEIDEMNDDDAEKYRAALDERDARREAVAAFKLHIICLYAQQGGSRYIFLLSKSHRHIARPDALHVAALATPLSLCLKNGDVSIAY
jgi:hypothetical protein